LPTLQEFAIKKQNLHLDNLFFECHYSNESFLDQMHKYRSLFLQRELVTYLISSVSGAKVFKNHNPCPPATWINVFDKKRRYKKATEYDKNFQKHGVCHKEAKSLSR
jgi:hypothetical protein